jgi:hypothetical protein
MVGYATERYPLSAFPLWSGGQHDVQLTRGYRGVVVKHFVEITEAKE